MKPKYITIVMLLLIAAAVAGWKIQEDKKHQQLNVYVPPKQQATQTNQSLGAQVYQQSQNPVAGQVPSSNPFDQSANPVEQSYTNPF